MSSKHSNSVLCMSMQWWLTMGIIENLCDVYERHRVILKAIVGCKHFEVDSKCYWVNLILNTYFFQHGRKQDNKKLLISN